MSNLKDDLAKIIQGEAWDDPHILELNSRDASIFEITPEVVVSPKDSKDVGEIVKYVLSSDKKLSITPRSAGTDMSGGSIGESIILDMTHHFNTIIDIENNTATVEPGVYYRDLEKILKKQGLLLPSYPASKNSCTVGGMTANNSSGEKTLSYGSTIRYVNSLKAVLSDGNEYLLEPLDAKGLEKKLAQKDFEGDIYRKVHKLLDDYYTEIKDAKPQTSKNSTGYLLWEVWDNEIFNLAKLFTGSQGTLGVITEIEFSLVEPNPHSSVLVVPLKDTKKLDEIVTVLLQQNPECFECFDGQTLKYAVRFLPEIIKLFKHHQGLSAYLLMLPEIIRYYTNSLPKLVLLAEFTAKTKKEAEYKSKIAKGALGAIFSDAFLVDERKSEKYWTIRHESYNLFRHQANKDFSSAPFIDDIIVLPKTLPEFLPKLNKILSHYHNLIYTLAGHIGDGNFHIIPLVNFHNPQTKEIIYELTKKVHDLVFEYGGSMSAEHNDGLMRGPYLEQMYGGEIFGLMKKIKQIFDPKGIFNPHKKTEASFDYSMKHVKKS